MKTEILSNQARPPLVVTYSDSDIVMMENSINNSVLVVDDDSMMREILKLILRGGEYPIAGEASNGEDAISLCTELNPAIVLLDINLPQMDGLQVLASIRLSLPETKVIMVSAEASLDKVRDAIAKGASGFIVKPFNPTLVLERIADCIKQA